MKQLRTVLTFGTFDLFHLGHLRILERAKDYGDRLIVGISSDDLTFRKKNIHATYTEHDRMRIVEAIRYVDGVFLEESLERKRGYLLEHHAGVLIMGDDWAGRFDEFKDICKIVYLPRTANISTTDTKVSIVNSGI